MKPESITDQIINQATAKATEAFCNRDQQAAVSLTLTDVSSLSLLIIRAILEAMPLEQRQQVLETLKELK